MEGFEEKDGMVWYGRAGPVASDCHGGSMGRVGQRLLLRVVSLAPNQIIVRINLGPTMQGKKIEKKTAEFQPAWYGMVWYVICYLYVLTFHRISETHTRSELALIICVNRDLVLRFLRCYEVLDFLVLG